MNAIAMAIMFCALSYILWSEESHVIRQSPALVALIYLGWLLSAGLAFIIVFME